MRKNDEMLFEHNNGAKLKLSQVYFKTKVKSQPWMERDSYKWLLQWQAPSGTTWNEIGTWTRRSTKAHSDAFAAARDALDHVTFEPNTFDLKRYNKQLVK